MACTVREPRGAYSWPFVLIIIVVLLITFPLLSPEPFPLHSLALPSARQRCNRAKGLAYQQQWGAFGEARRKRGNDVWRLQLIILVCVDPRRVCCYPPTRSKMAGKFGWSEIFFLFFKLVLSNDWIFFLSPSRDISVWKVLLNIHDIHNRRGWGSPPVTFSSLTGRSCRLMVSHLAGVISTFSPSPKRVLLVYRVSAISLVNDACISLSSVPDMPRIM